jgi:hypothetical protein|tara:strand:+ start:298 stop:1188 length:891 start_codon:yes stop_codon:yes gene_type:complete
MADTQPGNTQQESPDVDILNMPEEAQRSDDSQAFFDALDKSVNSAIYDDEITQPTSEMPADNKAEVSPDVSSAGNTPNNTDVGNLQNRYSASSREAKRLNSRLGELEPYVPILDAMREDPNLIQHVRGYFEGGGNAPTSMRENLNLGEDFSFDSTDAFDDPNSDSARVLNATIDGLVQKRLSSYATNQKAENAKLASESDFRSKYQLDEDEWSDLVTFAKSKQLDLEDIYYLKNRTNREENIKRSTQEEVGRQMQNMREMPQSLASSGASEHDNKTPDDATFDMLLEGENINRLLG